VPTFSIPGVVRPGEIGQRPSNRVDNKIADL
jgi:hypothetical protein